MHIQPFQNSIAKLDLAYLTDLGETLGKMLIKHEGEPLADRIRSRYDLVIEEINRRTTS